MLDVAHDSDVSLIKAQNKNFEPTHSNDTLKCFMFYTLDIFYLESS